MSGSPKNYSDRDVSLMACDDCGTLLWFEDVTSNVLGVFSGVLPAETNIKPEAHIWVHRKQDWLELDNLTPQYDDHISHEDWRSLWSASSLARADKDRLTFESIQDD